MHDNCHAERACFRASVVVLDVVTYPGDTSPTLRYAGDDEDRFVPLEMAIAGVLGSEASLN